MKPSFEIWTENKFCVIIYDLGPWDKYLSVTNGAEEVVAGLLPMLRGRRLLYYDSEGELGELLIADGKFAGFGLA